MKNRKLLLILIVLTGFFLRLNLLDSVPPHPSLDEVSIGYNAYSILKTGMDEFGNSHPILLRAYDDYRPAHYTYLVVPFIKLFGLNVFAVRMPSALLSIATIISVYFLIKSLFRKFKRVELLALATTGMLAISPWHIYISRLG
ncbi:MAG: glycosyltransferase family 39 protein, partial [Candidatus Levybacteria bacterium]|nr:glycosyltransferase family 39 protein [Candidatus Levybacteria bacterium]